MNGIDLTLETLLAGMALGMATRQPTDGPEPGTWKEHNPNVLEAARVEEELAAWRSATSPAQVRELLEKLSSARRLLAETQQEYGCRLAQQEAILCRLREDLENPDSVQPDDPDLPPNHAVNMLRWILRDYAAVRLQLEAMKIAERQLKREAGR